MARSDHGFTLIEVLAGVVVIGLVSGVLLIVLSDLIRAAGNTDRTSTAARLAEERARQIYEELRLGSLIDTGTDSGEFPEPFEYLGWQIFVEEEQLPLPEDYDRKEAPSPLFAAPSSQRLGPEPVLKRIAVTVVDLETEEPATDPFVFYAVDPATPPAGPDPNARQPADTPEDRS